MAGFIRDDHQELEKANLKHFCKICKKGFGCGRALGGHMRAHGINAADVDSSTTSPPDNDDDYDDDPFSTSDWDHNEQTNHNNNNKSNFNVDPTSRSNRRMYALRTNPNRLKTNCRICHNCGKEFFSWKSFLEHGKCTSDDDDIDIDIDVDSSPPCSDDNDHNNNNNTNWSKRKRSLRLKVGSPPAYSNEEEDLAANCLMMLSHGVVDRMFQAQDEMEEESNYSNFATKLDDHHHTITKPINFIPPLSYRLPAKEAAAPKAGMFQCKACKKVFNSHQALGGHRASHKKVKGCFAARLDHMDLDNHDVFHDHQDSFLIPTSKPNNNNSSSVFQYENGLATGSSSNMAASSSKRKAKVHECSICHRIFSSGQALGGHKRCHWITSNSNNNAVAAEAPPNIPKNMVQQLPLDLKLDLNLVATADGVPPQPFEVSTEIYLQSWPVSKNDKLNQKQQQHFNHKLDTGNNKVNEEDQNSSTKNKNIIITNNNNNNNVLDQEEDEGDSKVIKLAKFSELKDINMNGGSSSPWLQVGIGSTTDPNS